MHTLYAHKFRGCEIKVSSEWLAKLALSTQKCGYCDCVLDWTGPKNGGAKANSPTLDRLNHEQVITEDNLQIICYNCNATKRGRTANEFVEYCDKIAKKSLPVLTEEFDVT
jgi:hypothetical protein